MRISELQNKKIINILDGKEIGKIIDLELDDKGNTLGLVVEKHKFLINYIKSSKEIVIKWCQINKIGEDVILVNIVY